MELRVVQWNISWKCNLDDVAGIGRSMVLVVVTC
jgi:hypothetical protein